jgi:flagellar assembly protein FliH
MSSSAELPFVFANLKYREISGWDEDVNTLQLPDASGSGRNPKKYPEFEITKAEFDAQIARERADAVRESEQLLRKDYEQKLLAARAPIVAAIESFERQRSEYFAKVEAEVVQLALAIAAKILHREAQVDPMLVAALVRIAMESLREGSNVIVRVAPDRGEAWRLYFGSITSSSKVEIVEDPNLTSHECMVETELGSANFGLSAQLKEVEQGFFDLLALRPAIK